MLLVRLLAFDARFAVGYENVRYRPNQTALEYLRRTEGLRITLFHGSWCLACRESVPVLNQVLVAMPAAVQLRFVPIDLEYADPGGLARQYGVTDNPTVVLELHGVEVGRLVEEPLRGMSWEESMVALIERHAAAAAPLS